MPITCPYCGTHYRYFQPNCDNCGGSLPLPDPNVVDPTAVIDQPEAVTPAKPIRPPEAPRNVPNSHIWKLMSTSVGPILGGIFGVMGLIFTILGVMMTITIVAAMVGIPFLLIGVVFLGVGAPLFFVSLSRARTTLKVIRQGQEVLGQIVRVEQNFQVSINGRHPWKLTYQFEVGGKKYQGVNQTLSIPDLSQRPGQSVYVLYNPENPTENSIYPNPFGYYLMD